MKIGFTGTQRGMTKRQLLATHLLMYLCEQGNRHELHHGDCIGADAQAHCVAVAFGIVPILHPPIIETKRAFCSIRGLRDGFIYPPKPYLQRNKNIVTETEALIAAPGEEIEKQRSGTWSTVRFARKLWRPIFIVLPGGELQTERKL